MITLQRGNWPAGAEPRRQTRLRRWPHGWQRRSRYSNQLDYAGRLRDEGATIAEIVAETGITRTSLYRHLPPREPDLLTLEPTAERTSA